MIDRTISNKIVSIRYIMSLIVVAAHAATFTKLNNPGNILELISYKLFFMFDPLVNIALAFFFLTSAFLFYINLTDENCYEKIKKRVKSLLIPFLLWQIIGTFINFKIVPFDMFAYNVITSSYYGVMWFIEFLFLFSLLSPIIRIVFKIKWLGAMVVIFVTLFQLSGYVDFREFQFLSDAFARFLNRSFSFAYIYLLGAFLGMHFSTKILDINYSVFFRLSAFIVFVFSIFITGNSINAFAYSTLLAVCPICIWIFTKKEWFTKTTKWYVAGSFWIYAIHPLALSAVRRVVMATQLLSEEIVLTSVNPIYGFAWRSFMTTSTVIISIISAYIMIRFFPKIYEILSGGRIPKLKN